MEMQGLTQTIAYRIAPDLPVYSADDLLRFADETDKLKQNGGLMTWVLINV